MSALNAWLLFGASVLVGVYLVNAFVYRRRFGRLLRPPAQGTSGAASVSASQIASAAVVVLAGTAYVAAPIFAVESGVAQWLLEPYSALIYVTWCVLIASMVGSLLAVAGFLAKNR